MLITVLSNRQSVPNAISYARKNIIRTHFLLAMCKTTKAVRLRMHTTATNYLTANIILLEVSASTNFDWYMYAYRFEDDEITPQWLRKMNTGGRNVIKNDFDGKVSHLYDRFS